MLRTRKAYGNTMYRVILAERCKQKRSFCEKLPLAAPAVTLVTALFFTLQMPSAFPPAAWNWWYAMLLHGMVCVICYLQVRKDKDTGYYHMLSLSVMPQECWMGKIYYCSLLLLCANLFLFLGILAGSIVLGSEISLGSGLAAALLLSISCLWEIPLFLFLGARFGMFACIFSGIVLGIGGTSLLADTALWWVMPVSIPMRLMCPVLGILPNGLPVPEGSGLYRADVILPGTVLSLLWFAALAHLTVRWFGRMEAEG